MTNFQEAQFKIVKLSWLVLIFLANIIGINLLISVGASYRMPLNPIIIHMIWITELLSAICFINDLLLLFLDLSLGMIGHSLAKTYLINYDDRNKAGVLSAPAV